MNATAWLTSIEALGFATAAALCAMLLVTHRPLAGERDGARAYRWLWITGLVYACGAFAAACIALASPERPRSVDFAESVAWVSTCFGPWVFAGLADPYVRSRRVRRTLAILANVAVFALASRFLFLIVQTDFQVGDTVFPSHSFYVSLAFASAYIGAAFIGDQSNATLKRRPIVRWFVPSVTTLATLQVLATIALIHGTIAVGPLRIVAALISTLWVLPWTLLLSFFLAQTRYADVALKRTVILFASICIAAFLAAQIPNVETGLPYVIATLAAAGVMIAAPFVFRLMHRWIDLILLRRPEYDVVKREFARSVRRVENEDELIAHARTTIERTLQVDASLEPQGVARAGVTAATLACVPVGTRYVLEIKALKGRSLMQQEFTFLESIALEMSYRLESLEFEAERRELRVREERLQRSLTEAKLSALRAQVDPHFLFNTLNTIADLVTRQPEQAEAMTERLAECFRYALSRHDKMLSTLDEELQFIRRYLEIEQVRFGARLRVQMRNDDGLGARQVPSLILQPIVENAVRHGLAPNPGGGNLSIVAKRVGEFLQLEVADDGVGMSMDRPQRVGIGLTNVRERLATLYRERARMSIGPGASGRGTCITLLLPLHEN